MLAQPSFQFRTANFEDDYLITKHFYQMWRDIGAKDEDIEPNWQEITLQFIQQARQSLHYQAFVAEIDKKVVGSASCQLYNGLYPSILTERYRKYGYIWGVYVEPMYRKKGIATQLTHLTAEYLKSLGCTRAVLNAAPSGQSVYQNLGFVDGNSMWLDLQG